MGITERPPTRLTVTYSMPAERQEVEKKACPKDFYQSAELESTGRGQGGLETMDLDGLGVKLQPLLLIN